MEEYHCLGLQKDSKSTKNDDKKAISQFQALCAALAATIGTGNIAGVAAIVTGGPGAVMEGGLAWDLSDTFNGLMMIPNLIGVVALLPLVLKITRNYVDRKIRGKDVAPILSYDEALQQEMAEKLGEDD